MTDADKGLVISQMQPGSEIVANFDALEARINDMLAIYKDVTIAKEDVPQAKKERAWLNSQAKEIDAVRLRVKREYMRPVDMLEANVKRVLAPIKECSAAIDAQIKAFEEQERQDRHVELARHYADFAGALADAVPYERVHKDSWLNKSTNLMVAFREIENIINEIAEAEHTLSTLGLAHELEAKAEYFATLSIPAAIARSKAIEDQLARAAALEAEKAAILQAQEDGASDTASSEEAEPEEQHANCTQDDEPHALDAVLESLAIKWTFTVECTEAQRDAIIAHIRSLGLTGTVRAAS